MVRSFFRETELKQGGTGKAVWASMANDVDRPWLLVLSTQDTARATIVWGQGDGVSRRPLIVDVPKGGTVICFIGRPVEIEWLDTSGGDQTVSVLPSVLPAWVQTQNFVIERVQTLGPLGVDAPALPPWACTVRLETVQGITAVLILFDSTGTPVAEIPANSDPVAVAGLSKVQVLTSAPAFTRVVYELVY